MWRIPKSSRHIQDFLDMKYRMFGQAVSEIYDCFGLCNVMTAFDTPFERLFYEDFNGGFGFKGGRVNTRRDIFIRSNSDNNDFFNCSIFACGSASAEHLKSVMTIRRGHAKYGG